MTPLRNNGRKSAAPAPSLCRRLESLEDRRVPAAVNIGDAAATEGGNTYRFTGSFVAQDAYGLAASRDIEVGPDGNVYVASHDTDVVKVFEGGTGRFLRDLATPGGELNGPWGMTFGTDGRLYVGGRYSHNVVRFDVASGASTVFVPAESGGLANVPGLAFGPDGNLYVASGGEGSGPGRIIKRFSGTTGAFLGDFVFVIGGNEARVGGIKFGPDGHLYAVSANSQVVRYDGQTGAYIDAFVPTGSGGLNFPQQLVFRGDGYLYVSDQSSPKVYRYSETTGAFVDVFATSPVGTQATGLAFAPTGELYISQGVPTLQPGSSVARFAPTRFAAFTVNLDAPATSAVTIGFATANGTALAGSDYAATSGTLTFAPGQTTRTILVSTLDDNVSELGEAFAVTLSNPIGATIADGQAVGTIADDEPPLPRVVSVDANGAAGAQRSRVTSITVRFNAAVTFAGAVADAFALARIGGGAVGGFTASAATVNGVTVVTLSNFTGAETQFGSLADGRFALTVRAAQVSANGQQLDGDGDGTAGDDYTLNGSVANGLYRLYGDVNGDGFVNAADFGPFRNAFGSSVGQVGYLAFLDLDGDGFINAFDFAQFRTRFGSSVP